MKPKRLTAVGVRRDPRQNLPPLHRSQRMAIEACDVRKIMSPAPRDLVTMTQVSGLRHEAFNWKLPDQ